MRRTYSLCLGVLVPLTSLTILHGEEAKTPRTDRYGDPLPPGAVMRLGTIRLRHADADVVFSKDGKQLISCGGDGDVRVWDVATGRRLQRNRLQVPFGETINKPILSSNGAMAATLNSQWVTPHGMRTTVRLYDTRTGKEIGRLPIRAERGSLRFSPDGRFLALQTVDGEMRRPLQICRTAPFTQERAFRLFPYSAFFSADGKRLAGICSDEKVRVCDVISGAEIITSHDRIESKSLAFSPDGKALAVGSKNSGQARLLDAATLKEKVLLKPPANVKAHSIDPVMFSPDGRRLACAYYDSSSDASPQHGVLIWDLTGARSPRCLPERYDSRLVFAPDGKTLACRDDTQTEIRLWDVDSGRLLHRWSEHRRAVEAREKATRELTRLRYRAEPILRRALTEKPSLEMRRRVEAILAGPQQLPTEALRMLRAIAVLERIGTPEARRILEKLADGAVAPETHEAKNALQRLSRR